MENNQALAAIPDSPLALMPVMSVERAVERYQGVVKFVQKLMNEGTDFGKIPNTDKPTLLKPGAEKLTTFFGLSKRFHLAEKIEDWTGMNHGGEPFFYYLYRCALYHGENLIAESDGSCNSFESKYRWRQAERTCPACGTSAIIKGREEYGGGWLCFKKKGGCGAKFDAGSAEIESQQVGRVANPDVCDQVNTFQKMAQKRAFIAATLLAVNASEFFTQDVEDFVDGGADDAPVAPRKAAAATARKTAAKAAASATVVPAAEKVLNDLLLAHCIQQKGDKNGAAFFESMYAKKSAAEKAGLIRELRLSAPAVEPEPEAEPAIEPTPAEGEVVEAKPLGPDHGKVLDLTEALKESGQTYDAINAKIAALCGGVYAVEELDNAQAAKAANSLAKWHEQLKGVKK